MNININSTVINKILKNDSIQSNSISGAEKVNLEAIENAYNNLLKSDSYSNSTSGLQSKKFSDLFSFVKKMLYNEQFREIAINSNPILKEAYDNFISAITMDDSKLGEYIKTVLNDSSKFSGEFFDTLNKIYLETNDNGLKNSIYEFLKIFDYYFTQIENASGVNSSLNDILSNLPEEIKNKLLELLANSSISKLNIFLLSAFNLNLPEREKLKVILSYMLDLVSAKDNIKNDSPLNIFMPKEQVSNDTIDYANTIVKALKNSNAELPKDIKSLFDALGNAINNTIKSTQNYNNQDKILWSAVLKEQEANVELIVKLAQSITNNENNFIENNLDVLVKFIQGLKESVPLSILNSLNNISSQNTADILMIFDSIKKEILMNDGYTNEVKEQLVFLLDKTVTSMLEKLVFGDVSKNKCELLLNIYEKEIMPILLKNNAVLPKNTLSALTHNLLRLKLGTASEFSKQVTELFNHLNNKIIDMEQALYMKFELAKKIISKQETNEGINSFLKLLDSGIKFSSNDLNKTTFENILLSLISKNDINTIYKHLFIPLLYNGANILSEIFISKEKKTEDENNKFEETLDTILKVTLIFDIEEKGIFNTTLFYADGQVSAKIIMPENYQSFNEEVTEDISKIIQKNNLIPKGVLVTN